MGVFTGIRNELHQILDKEIRIRHKKIEQEGLTESSFAYHVLWDEIADLWTLKEIIGRWLRENQGLQGSKKNG